MKIIFEKPICFACTFQHKQNKKYRKKIYGNVTWQLFQGHGIHTYSHYSYFNFPYFPLFCNKHFMFIVRIVFLKKLPFCLYHVLLYHIIITKHNKVSNVVPDTTYRKADNFENTKRRLSALTASLSSPKLTSNQ